MTSPGETKHLGFAALVREYILPYNTLFAISGVLAFLLGLVSPALVVAFGMALLLVALALIVVNARRRAVLAWVHAETGRDTSMRRLARLVWPSPQSMLHTSGLFWVVCIMGAAVTLYGTTGVFHQRAGEVAPARTIEPSRANAVAGDVPRVVVLPLASEPQGSEAQSGLLAAGVTDDIMVALSRHPEVKVLGRSTAAAIAARGLDHTALRQQFAINYVIAGRLRVAGEEYRLHVELAETAGGTTTWSDRLAGPVSDVVNLGEEVVRLVVGRVAARILQSESRSARKGDAATLSAYELTLQARQLWRKPTRESLAKAQELLRRALERDPAYAPAHVYMAFTTLTAYNNSWAEGFGRAETIDRMLALASRAVELDPGNATAHAAQAIAYTYQGRHAEAMVAARQAMRLNGTEPENLARVGQVMSFSGQHQEAIEVLQLALDLDPLGPAQVLNFLSRAHFFTGDNDMAVAQARRCLERSSIEPCQETLAAALALGGKPDEAAAAWRQIASARGDVEPTQVVARLMRAFKERGDLERLERGLNQARNAASRAGARPAGSP